MVYIIHYGNRWASGDVEDFAGVRDYLFCVGIHISGDSCGGARSSTTDSGGDSVFCGGRSPLCLDDRARGALTERARMEVGMFTGDSDFRYGLWTAVLGGAACAFGNCRGHAGDDSGVHGAVGNYFSADADVDCPFGAGAFDRGRRSGGADEPVVEPRRSADRQDGRGGAYLCVDQLVGSVGAYAQADVAGFQGDELGSADAGRRSVPGSHRGGARRDSYFSSLERVTRDVVRAAVPDCRGVYCWFYCVCMADSS